MKYSKEVVDKYVERQMEAIEKGEYEMAKILGDVAFHAYRLKQEMEAAFNKDVRRRMQNVGHGCSVDSHFFGTSVSLGDLKITFYRYRGRPAFKVQTKFAGPTVIKKWLTPEGELEDYD